MVEAVLDPNNASESPFLNYFEATRATRRVEGIGNPNPPSS